MPKHLCRIAIPFSVLNIDTFFRRYLSNSNQMFKSFRSPYNFGRSVLAEIMLIHFD